MLLTIRNDDEEDDEHEKGHRSDDDDGTRLARCRLAHGVPGLERTDLRLHRGGRLLVFGDARSHGTRLLGMRDDMLAKRHALACACEMSLELLDALVGLVLFAVEMLDSLEGALLAGAFLLLARIKCLLGAALRRLGAFELVVDLVDHRIVDGLGAGRRRRIGVGPSPA